MFGSSGGSPTSVLAPLAVVVLVLVLRNSRARELKIERLWVLPLIYLVGMASALSAAPPPLTVTSIALLVASFLLGAAIGWQRARLVEIHIHPETHALSSRASPIGLVFILAILALRYAARDYLAANARFIGVDVVTIGDAFLVLAVAMLSVQRLEVWRRSTQMLAEARGGGPTPPDPLVR